MADAPDTVLDGYLSMEGGVDSGFAPTLLRENELAWAVNWTVRGGFGHPRPGFKYQPINFATEESIPLFEEGLFQGAGTYNDANGAATLLVSVSGRMFAIKVADFSLRDITIPGDRNSAYQPHAWFQQAENTTIIQNNLQKPQFWNGISLRRSVIATQVPVGGPMAYLKGRLWVARGSEFFGGDLVNSYPTLGRESVLQFQENTFLNEGGAFSAAGKISGMIATSNIDTTLGAGDLLIGTLGKIQAFDAPVDRTVWKNLTYPIERFAVLTSGSVSAESMVVIQNDLMFRSRNGINSFKYARADFDNWGNTPISRQVGRALEWDTPAWLEYASGVEFDNRSMFTIQPRMVNGRGVVHKGLVVLDYHLVSGLGRKTDPCWEGVWTGLDILRILTVSHNDVQRCFIFALDEDLKIRLWEVTLANRFDVGPGNEDQRISWIAETKSYTYGKPRELKILESLENWYDQLTGQADILFKFRPNLSECWTEWTRWSACARYQSCGLTPAEECQAVQPFRSQARPRMALPTPPETIDPSTGGPANTGYDFQFRMEGTGYLRLNRSITKANLPGDEQFGDFSAVTCIEPNPGDCSNKDCKEQTCCDPSDFLYSSGNFNRARISGHVFLKTPDDPTAYEIWTGRVGLDASTDGWITDESSLLIPQFLFWGGLASTKLTLVSQTVIDGDYAYTSVVGGTPSTQTYGAVKSMTTPPWSDGLSVQKFDPAVLGEPISVDITTTNSSRCAPRAQNLDTVNPQDVTVGMTSTIVFLYPSTDVLPSIDSAPQVTFSCSAYVFPTDFAGPSGFVVDPPISDSDSTSTILTDSSPQWPDLIGSGSALFSASASEVDIKYSTPGPTDLAFQLGTNEIGGEISMEWSYHPFEGYWIFCIDNAAPWEPTSFSIPMATLADLGGAAPNRGEINGFGYEVVEDFAAKQFKLFRSAAQVVAGGGSVTVVGTEGPVGEAIDPFPGVTVNLYQTASTEPVFQTDVSAAGGFYLFDNLAAGDYVVKVVIPAGYVIDPDSNEEIAVTLTEGQNAADKDFYLNTSP